MVSQGAFKGAMLTRYPPWGCEHLNSRLHRQSDAIHHAAHRVRRCSGAMLTVKYASKRSASADDARAT